MMTVVMMVLMMLMVMNDNDDADGCAEDGDVALGGSPAPGDLIDGDDADDVIITIIIIIIIIRSHFGSSTGRWRCAA